MKTQQNPLQSRRRDHNILLSSEEVLQCSNESESNNSLKPYSKITKSSHTRIASPIFYDGENRIANMPDLVTTLTTHKKMASSASGDGNNLGSIHRSSSFDLLIDPYGGEKERRHLSLVRSERLMHSKLAPNCTSPNALSPSGILVNNYMYTSSDNIPIRQLFEQNGDQDLLFNAHVTQIELNEQKTQLQSSRVVLIVTDMNLYLATTTSDNSHTNNVSSGKFVDLNSTFTSYHRTPLKFIKNVSVSHLRDSFLFIHCTRFNSDSTEISKYHQIFSDGSIMIYTEKKTELIQVLSQALKHSSPNCSLLSNNNKNKNQQCSSPPHVDVQVSGAIEWQGLMISFVQLNETSQQMISSSHNNKMTQIANDCWIDWTGIGKQFIRILLTASNDVDNSVTLDSVFVFIRESTKEKSETSSLRIPSETMSYGSMDDDYNSSKTTDGYVEQVHMDHKIDITDQLQPCILMPSKDSSYHVMVKFLANEPLYKCRLVEKVDTAFRTSIFTTEVGTLNPLTRHKCHTILIPPKQAKYSKVSYTKVEITLYGCPASSNNSKEQILLSKSFVYNVDNSSHNTSRRHSVLGNLLGRLSGKRSSM